MEFFFSKTFTEKSYSEFMQDIGSVKYYKCIKCGFVFSKTYSELDDEIWERLNHRYHQHINSTFYLEEHLKNNKSLHASPHLQLATMINVLQKENIITNDPIFDYAAGHGFLSRVLKKYYLIDSINYEPFARNNLLSYENIGGYKIVLNSAMFEHIRKRDDIEKINNLVAGDGVFILHTVVCENIPRDANWFYLLPVHCAFHTNKSMNILMDQWKYESSLYCPAAKSWVMFRWTPENIEKSIIQINSGFKENYLYYKKGFVDYWKGF
jgi:hypothetical protein